MFVLRFLGVLAGVKRVFVLGVVHSLFRSFEVFYQIYFLLFLLLSIGGWVLVQLMRLLFRRSFRNFGLLYRLLSVLGFFASHGVAFAIGLVHGRPVRFLCGRVVIYVLLHRRGSKLV